MCWTRIILPGEEVDGEPGSGRRGRGAAVHEEDHQWGEADSGEGGRRSGEEEDHEQEREGGAAVQRAGRDVQAGAGWHWKRTSLLLC